MDPLRHPDLIEVARRLRRQLSQVLEAEQEAAAITLRRRSSIRDRLLDAEDRHEAVVITCIDGVDRAGPVGAVGADHVVLAMRSATVCIALSHIVAIRSTTE